MRVILLIIIGLSVLNAEIIRDSDGIVTDARTNLQWQDDVVLSSIAWETAINYCESLTLGGHSDWRLPNINTLKSMVDRSKSPAIFDGFINTSSRYWSSTTYEDRKSDAWYVNGDGSTYLTNKGSSLSVRCVRDWQ